MSTEDKAVFVWEDKYLVLKRSNYPAALLRDIAKSAAFGKKYGIPNRTYAVVEDDWPEYPLVRYMIEQRMAGKSQLEILADLYISAKIEEEEEQVALLSEQFVPLSAEE